MKVYVWDGGMNAEECKNGAYWERNMIVLLMALQVNRHADSKNLEEPCGWYYHGEWDGWSRVISLYKGRINFHVPDDFDLGKLPQIEPSWDGHSTREKWELVMEMCGCEPELAQSAPISTESPSASGSR